MKKTIIAVALIFAISTAVFSCREKTTGEKVEDAVESVGEDIEEGAKDVKEKVEEGAEEVKEEIEKATD